MSQDSKSHNDDQPKVTGPKKILILFIAGIFCIGIIVAGYFVATSVMKRALLNNINQTIEDINQ